MNTYQVKQTEYKRPKPKNRLLVRSGVIVDPLLEVAVSDPIWRQWFNEGAPTSTYVPFQDVDASSVLPSEQREDWIGA